MRVYIRVDSSVPMGSGHLMRCLTLAGELKESGAEISFICRNHPGNLNHLVKQKGFCLYELSGLPRQKDEDIKYENEYAGWLAVPWQQDAGETIGVIEKHGRLDWMVIDHYGLDERWEKRLRPHTSKIMVIDDLANRRHDCDLLLDQNLYENMEQRYDGLVPDSCKQLLGPQYALLRPEFCEARAHLRKRDGIVRRILIFFGGSDPTNETKKALDAIKLLDRPDIAVDVVVGANNPHRDEIREICADMPNTSYYCQVENMAELMANADLAIGAGGAAAWERCYLGLPTLIIIIAENQSAATKILASTGAVWNLGNSSEVSSDNIYESLQEITDNTVAIITMSEISMNVIFKRHVRICLWEEK